MLSPVGLKSGLISPKDRKWIDKVASQDGNSIQEYAEKEVQNKDGSIEKIKEEDYQEKGSMVQYPEISMESTAKLGTSTAALNSAAKGTRGEMGDQIRLKIVSGKDETPREPAHKRAKTQV
jgi:hypothetical protein